MAFYSRFAVKDLEVCQTSSTGCSILHFSIIKLHGLLDQERKSQCFAILLYLRISYETEGSAESL